MPAIQSQSTIVGSVALQTAGDCPMSDRIFRRRFCVTSGRRLVNGGTTTTLAPLEPKTGHRTVSKPPTPRIAAR